MNYYVALQTKSQAFVLEQRMKAAGVPCELTYMPREIMKDLCNMGVKINNTNFDSAAVVLKYSGLPGYKVFKETIFSTGCSYMEIGVTS